MTNQVEGGVGACLGKKRFGRRTFFLSPFTPVIRLYQQMGHDPGLQDGEAEHDELPMNLRCTHDSVPLVAGARDYPRVERDSNEQTTNF